MKNEINNQVHLGKLSSLLVVNELRLNLDADLPQERYTLATSSLFHSSHSRRTFSKDRSLKVSMRTSHPDSPYRPSTPLVASKIHTPSGLSPSTSPTEQSTSPMTTSNPLLTASNMNLFKVSGTNSLASSSSSFPPSSVFPNASLHTLPLPKFEIDREFFEKQAFLVDLLRLDSKRTIRALASINRASLVLLSIESVFFFLSV